MGGISIYDPYCPYFDSDYDRDCDWSDWSDYDRDWDNDCDAREVSRLIDSLSETDRLSLYRNCFASKQNFLEERRIARNDDTSRSWFDCAGNAYTYSEFQERYGEYADEEWSEALFRTQEYECNVLISELASEPWYRCEGCQQTWWPDCCTCFSLELDDTERVSKEIDLYAEDAWHVDQSALDFYHERHRTKKRLRSKGEIGSRSGRCRPLRTRTRIHRKPKKVASIVISQ